jgi:hypothetical protein
LTESMKAELPSIGNLLQQSAQNLRGNRSWAPELLSFFGGIGC